MDKWILVASERLYGLGKKKKKNFSQVLVSCLIEWNEEISE